MMRVFLIAGLVLFSVVAGAQSTRDVGSTPPPPVYQSSKQKKGFFLIRLFQNKKKDNRIKTPYEKREEFEARMKNVARQKAKEARLEGKPEYSNKFYFGHKRKPKKRPPGKKKWCKICEFAH